jgi:hypothetical protein
VLNIVTLKYVMLIVQRAMWTNGYSLCYTYQTHVSAHTHTEQVTGNYVNLPMNNPYMQVIRLVVSSLSCEETTHCFVLLVQYLFWPEISLTKIMHGNMPCHDAKFIF